MSVGAGGAGGQLSGRCRRQRRPSVPKAPVGSGAGFGLPIVPLPTLALTVGGIVQKPWLVEGRVEPREILALTASFDHDIVDGAPAARFASCLRELVEGAEVLQGLPPMTAAKG